MEEIKQNKGCGVIEVISREKVTKENLSRIYTPGVASLVRDVMADEENVYKNTWKGNTIAVVSDGSAILGLGNQGAKAALPVMEAKSALFKELGDVNAVPIVLDTQDSREIILIVKAIAPGFGGINLEDISAPRCFEILSELERDLDIPIFHDDQYGTAIVVLAGIINSLKVTGKKIEELKIIISGAGAAGFAIADLLLQSGAKNIIVFDSKGAISKTRDDLKDPSKQDLANRTNHTNFKGTLKESMAGTDLFVGVSAKNLLVAKDIEKMNQNSIVFALANPDPEILPEEALKSKNLGIIATGRSDFPNQINNALVFPGIFKGALATRTVKITNEIKIEIAKAIAAIVKEPTKEEIIPSVMNLDVVDAVVEVFKNYKNKK
jgi:malate dehydrogenase (oxaloacetate-decarboxylating)